MERFWQRCGWSREQLDVAWTFDSRADFEAVIEIELPPEVATAIIAEDSEQTVADYAADYAVTLWWRRF